MKIAIYTHEFAPSVGGIEIFVMGLARALTRAGRAVVVITARAAGGFDDRTLPFRVVRRPSLRALARELREADLVHLAGPVFAPMVLALLLRKRLVIEHHGWQSACPNGQMYLEADDAPCPGWFMRRRYDRCLRCNAGAGRGRSLRMLAATFPRRWLAQRADVNIAPSAVLARGLRLARSIVVHHAVDADLETESDFVQTSDVPVLAYVGRLVTTKGIGVLLAAAKELRARHVPFVLDVFGDGPERQNLERQAHDWQLDECVRFRGAIAPDARRRALEHVRAVVMPTLAEIFGLVAAEAMMLGKAVVVSDLPVMREVVGEAGAFARPGDPQALADVLQPLLEHPSRMAALGAAGRKRALAMYREPRMLREHFAIYDRSCRVTCDAATRADVIASPPVPARPTREAP